MQPREVGTVKLRGGEKQVTNWQMSRDTVHFVNGSLEFGLGNKVFFPLQIDKRVYLHKIQEEEVACFCNHFEGKSEYMKYILKSVREKLEQTTKKRMKSGRKVNLGDLHMMWFLKDSAKNKKQEARREGQKQRLGEHQAEENFPEGP